MPNCVLMAHRASHPRIFPFATIEVGITLSRQVTSIMQLFRTISSSSLAAAIVATSMLGYVSHASAQPYSNGYYGLADISYLGGPTTIVRGDSGAQVAATINAPVGPGDYVVTGPGFAEMQFDGSTMLRLASNSQVRLVNMAPGSREVQVASGTAQLAVLSGQSGNTQIDTPTATVQSNQIGDYRVTVPGSGETLVTVRRGSATVSSSSGSQNLTPGGTLVCYGNSTSMQNAVAFDSFDQFNSSRDQAAVTAYNANPYISPQLAGYSNLASYGQWQNVPGYGYAWAPNSQYQSNYPPYQNGQWVWEPGYGYTWVDNSPYGYTTSHYGTWFNNPNYGGWLWQPPATQYQNSSLSLVSAFVPAAVSFFLTGGNLQGMLGSNGYSNNYGNADIGWIPLAPGEQYQPWYGQNYSYPTTTYSTVPNITNIYNYYTNAYYYRGVTMVSVNSWRNGNFANRIVPQPAQIRQMALIRGAIPVVPTASNLRYRTTTAAHPVVLARTFTAPRLAARAPVTTHIAFVTQRARIAAIASAHPHVVTFHPAPAKVTPPVYHPVARAPVHLAPLAPVRTTVKTTTSHPQPKPVAKPQAKPVVHTKAKPVVHPQAPVVPREPAHSAATPVPAHHEAAPVQHPATHTIPEVAHPAQSVAPVHQATPVAHPAAPVERPATRPAKPAATPPGHAAAPVAPSEKPTAKPTKSPRFT
jgi:hypothetical protein